MCGRYASAKRDVDLLDESESTETVGEAPPPSWNVAPTQDSRVVVERPVRADPDAAPIRRLQTMRWGLVPSWAADPTVGGRMINARLETLHQRPAYRVAAARRRCLVPTIGYYEWQRLPGGGKQAQFLHRGGDTLWFAGLYDVWRDPRTPGADPLGTFTLLTTTAADALGHIHDRSPVILPPKLWDTWLDPTARSAELAQQIAAAAGEPVLAVRAVSPAVGNHRNDGAHLIEPIDAVAAPTQPALFDA